MEFIDISADDGNIDDLGEIDTSGQEVYECAALEELDQEDIQDKPSNYGGSLDYESATPIKETRKMMEGPGLEKLMNNLVIANTSYNNPIAPESVEKRLLRIEKELEDISGDQLRDLSPQTAQKLKDTKGLYSQVSKAYKDRLGTIRKVLTEELEADGELEMISLPCIAFDTKDMRRLLNLERRVHNIETLVGPRELTDKSLATELGELAAQAKLIHNDSETLDQFHRRVQEIEKEYENSLLGRKSKDDRVLHRHAVDQMESQESRVNELYRYLGVLKKYGPILPQLTNRIKEINGISMQQTESLNIIRTIDVSIEDLQKQVQQWEEVTQTMEQKLTAQEVELEENIKYFNHTVAKLEDRIRPSNSC